MIYQVTHRTAYTYEEDVSASYGMIHLLPRDLPGQSCLRGAVVVDPVPDDYRERLDFFGNRAAFFAIHTDHRRLTVTATSEVEVAGRQATLSLLGAQPWEEARAGSEPDLDVRQHTLDSPLVAASAALEEYALRSFTPGRPVFDALGDLARRIRADFEYQPGATTVTTSVEEVLRVRKGVCQDYAHLAIGCLRSLGLAARYVSGYLETDPPPGKPRLVGADVSHAWASLFVPGLGWVDVDPTNEQFVNDRYVTTACGRDYGDVPPLKGVIYTKGTEHELEVTVDVVRRGDRG